MKHQFGEWPQFFLSQLTIIVANSPRIGVVPGFDSQGCVTFLSQILLSQLVLNPLGHSWVSDSATNSNIQVHYDKTSEKPLVSGSALGTILASATRPSWLLADNSETNHIKLNDQVLERGLTLMFLIS